MRAIIRSAGLSLIPLLFVFSAIPQANNTPAKADNLYSMALFASIAEMEKSWGRINDSYQGGIRTDYHHMRVDKSSGITDGLPSQIGDYSVEYLDTQEQVDRYKKLQKGFSILGIAPMRNNGTELEITVSVSYVKYKKHKLYKGFSDWSDVKFRYDCESQKFVISNIKLGGI